MRFATAVRAARRLAPVIAILLSGGLVVLHLLSPPPRFLAFDLGAAEDRAGTMGDFLQAPWELKFDKFGVRVWDITRKPKNQELTRWEVRRELTVSTLYPGVMLLAIGLILYLVGWRRRRNAEDRVA